MQMSLFPLSAFITICKPGIRDNVPVPAQYLRHNLSQHKSKHLSNGKKNLQKPSFTYPVSPQPIEY